MPNTKKRVTELPHSGRPGQKRRATTKEEEEPTPDEVASSSTTTPPLSTTSAAESEEPQPQYSKELTINIQKLLHPNDEQGVKQAIQELKDVTFSTGFESSQNWKHTFDRAIGAGILPSLLSAMVNYPQNVTILEYGIRTLITLTFCSENANLFAVLVDLDAVGIILSGPMKHHSGRWTLQNFSISLLANLILLYVRSGAPALAQTLIDEIGNSIDAICSVMDNHKSSALLQRNACKLIATLIDKNTSDNVNELRSTLKAKKCLSKIAQALELHGSDADVQRWGEEAMQALVRK